MNDLVPVAGGQHPSPVPHADFVTWARVSPIFADHCTSCHDPTEQKGGLDLTTFAAARNGGGLGRVLSESTRLQKASGDFWAIFPAALTASCTGQAAW